ALLPGEAAAAGVALGLDHHPGNMAFDPFGAVGPGDLLHPANVEGGLGIAAVAVHPLGAGAVGAVAEGGLMAALGDGGDQVVAGVGEGSAVSAGVVAVGVVGVGAAGATGDGVGAGTAGTIAVAVAGGGADIALVEQVAEALVAVGLAGLAGDVGAGEAVLGVRTRWRRDFPLSLITGKDHKSKT